MELISLKEALYKEKGTNIKTLVGPAITMLLSTDGFLTVQQEIEAGMIDFTEEPIHKKRKTQTSMELAKGETSKPKKAPEILVARVEPAMAQPMLVPEDPKHLGAPSQVKRDLFKNVSIPALTAPVQPKVSNNVLVSTMEEDTSPSTFEPLTEILHKFRNTTQLLENWISFRKKSSNVTQHDCTLNSEFEKFSQEGNSRSHLQADYCTQTTLQQHYTSATNAELRHQGENLHIQTKFDQNPEIPVQPTKSLMQDNQETRKSDYLQQQPANRNTTDATSKELLHTAAVEHIAAHTQNGRQHAGEAQTTTVARTEQLKGDT